MMYFGERKVTSLVTRIGIGMVLLYSANFALAQRPREMLNRAEIVPHVGTSLPLDAEFLNHQGAPIRLDTITGERPTVLCLVYFECPMLCKLAADGLVRGIAGLSENVGQDFNVAFISFDPRDTPGQADAARTQALRQYARGDSGEGWYFLTGEQPAIDALTQAVGFHYAWDESSGQFSHASGLMIISPTGVVSQYLDGVRFTPHELSEAVENAASGTASAAEPISFARCYLYDPTTGKFGAAVQWTVRVLGLLTVLAIGAMIYRLSRAPTALEQPD